MQTIGILALTAGIWLVYSGVVGIQPLETLGKILADPNNASKIISTARVESAATVTVAGLKDSVMKRNPFAGLKVTADFEKHKARHSGWPGIDYAAPVGTPIFSPVSGTLRNDYAAGNAGYAAIVTTESGYKHYFAHLSKFQLALNNKPVRAGQIIGWSGGKAGAIGAGNSTGPHIHYSIQTPSGAWLDPAEWLSNLTARKANS